MKDFKIYLLISLFTLSINAQEKTGGLYIEKNTLDLRLNGPVKMVKMRYASIRKGLNGNMKSHHMALNDVRVPPYCEFYETGQSSLIVSAVPDTVYKQYGPQEKTICLYDQDDIDKKKSYVAGHRHYFPLSDHYLLFMPNCTFKNSYPVDENTSGTQLIQFFYQYLKDEKGRIREAVIYSPNNDTIQVKTFNDRDIQTRLVYVYNEKNQVIKQKVYAGPNANESFAFSMTESGYCKDLELRYQYDSQGRMTEALMYGCGGVIMQEDYTYNPDKDYVEKATYFVTGEGAFVHPAPRFTVTFNENGDILQKEYHPDKETYVTQNMATRYYTYEYDSHNNWIRCQLYLEGTREGEPTITAERTIEYFK